MTDDPNGGRGGFESSSRRRFLLSGAALAAGGLAGCTETPGNGGNGNGNGNGDGNGDGNGNGDGGSLSGEIAIAGSSTVFPLMEAVAAAFESEHPDVSTDISSTGSGGGFSNFFCPGETDFNNASRPIQAEEEELCADNDVEPVELQAATDALTVVVNNDNEFIEDGCVTVDELAQIWGEDAAETWSEVRDDWPDEEIERYGAAETSGTFDYFSETVNGESGDHTDDYQATERDNTIVQGVRGSEYAIGYFGFSYYFNNPDQVTALKVDGGDGCVEPSLDTASNGEYTPLSRPLFTYASKSSLAEEHVAEFARFFVEQAGNEELVAGQVGYVPLTDEQQSEVMDRLETAIQEAQD
ncbi:MAG: PstS family phosphate ABC transporter substrate-binding protein [Natronomonas sp.]